jgi:hypothetical protein
MEDLMLISLGLNGIFMKISMISIVISMGSFMVISMLLDGGFHGFNGIFD